MKKLFLKKNDTFVKAVRCDIFLGKYA
jgi:hypothetical protein